MSIGEYRYREDHLQAMDKPESLIMHTGIVSGSRYVASHESDY